MTLRFRLCVLTVLVVWPVLVQSEAPSRSDLADELLITRRTYFNPVGERFGGIWLLDPEELRYLRVRPFLPTFDTNRQIPHGYWGQDASLAAHGDVLSFQTWPGVMDFDVYSWRLIRRVPAASDPGEVGWAIQGPMLDLDDAFELGLEEGTFGNGRCVVIFQASGNDWGGRSCEAWPYPDTPDTTTTWGTDSVVLLKHPVAEQHLVELFAELDLLDWPSYPIGATPCLSADFRRRGFWRCRPDGAAFYDIDGGGLSGPSLDVDLTIPPFDREDVVVDRLVYHEPSDLLYGLGGEVISGGIRNDMFLFSLDPESGHGELLGEWHRAEYIELGAPNALSVLGPAPSTSETLVPIVADTPGSNGTQWTTELWFFNPSYEAMDVTVRRVACPTTSRSFTLAPHGSLAVRDVLAWVGGGAPEHDGLVVTSGHRWGEQLAVSGRISTPATDSGGRYGHAIQGLPGRIGYSNHTQYKAYDPELHWVKSTLLRPSQLSLDRRIPGRFRFNLGVVNDGDEPLTISLIWGYADEPEYWLRDLRPEGAEQELTVAPHDVQIVQIPSLFPEEIQTGWPPRLAVLGDRPAAVWMSMIDNLTGDATFVPFTNYTLENDNTEDRLVLPVVAHLQGENGTRWTTDLFGFECYTGAWNAPAWKDEPFAVYYPGDPDGDCGGSAASGSGIATYLDGEIGMPLTDWIETMSEVWYDPTPEEAERGWRTIFPDVIRLFPGCEDETASKGALEIATGSWFSGFSRTYTTRPDGGTYGGMLPLYPPGGWPTQHFGGLEVKPEQRINVGLYNGNAEHAITHELRLYAADGTLAATRRIVIHPHRLVQRPLERIMGLEEGALDDGLYGLSVIPLDDPELGVEGRSWAYVSLVDNITNDPVNLW